jgi:hypothetical protein
MKQHTHRRKAFAPWRARAQKWAGERLTSSLLAMRDLKHTAWQNQACHRPTAVSTVTRHGSISMDESLHRKSSRDFRM